jgi:hypothetical protein
MCERRGRASQGRNRRSRVKPLTPEKIKQVVDMTLLEKPPNATQWSARSVASRFAAD